MSRRRHGDSFPTHVAKARAQRRLRAYLRRPGAQVRWLAARKAAR